MSSEPAKVSETKLQQIVVMKGNCGFGDRLQVLSQCITYCLALNARIAVDWRDKMWGQGDLDFSTYFDIIGIPVVTIEEVAKLMEEGAVANPSAWTPELMRATPEKTRDIKYNLDEKDLKTETERIKGDILVFNTQGFRKFSNSNIINNIRMKPDIIELVKTKISKMELPCCTVHLRGTDRLNEKNTETIAKNNIEAIYQKLPRHCKVPGRCYVISDMEPMLVEWLKNHPECVPLQDESFTRQFSAEDLGDQSGIHSYCKEILDFYDIQKHDLNVECISEFVAMCFSDNAAGNKESCFFKMSRFINQCGNYDIGLWMDNWKPPIKSLKQPKK